MAEGTDGFSQGVSLQDDDAFIPSSVRPLLGLDDEEIDERDKEKADWKEQRRQEAEGRAREDDERRRMREEDPISIKVWAISAILQKFTKI